MASSHPHSNLAIALPGRDEGSCVLSGGGTRGPLLLAVGFVDVKRRSGGATPCNRLAEARVAAKEVAEIFFGVWNF